MTLMVVDDSPEQLSMLNGILNKDYAIKSFTSGKKALEYLDKDTDIDLILLDILMPEMDGFEVIKYIKDNPEISHIPIIFLTALEHESDIVQGFDLGAVDYIVKPYEPKVLKVRVKNHLKLKKFQDNLQNTIKEKDKLIIQQSKMAALGEMFDNIAHQWKQPLNIISLSCSNLEVLKKLNTLNEKSFFQSTKDIEQSIQHLSSTIDTFRNFIKEKNYKEHYSLEDLIEATIQLISSRIKKNSIQIDIKIDKMDIYGFKNETMQILMNLLSNSIDILKKQQSEPTISIYSKIEDNKLLLYIEDNGEGIKAEIKDKIFEKHFTTKSKQGGSGIGLHMSKKLATQKLNGDLKLVDSIVGAKFLLSIPYKEEENQC